MFCVFPVNVTDFNKLHRCSLTPFLSPDVSSTAGRSVKHEPSDAAFELLNASITPIV